MFTFGGNVWIYFFSTLNVVCVFFNKEIKRWIKFIPLTSCFYHCILASVVCFPLREWIETAWWKQMAIADLWFIKFTSTNSNWHNYFIWKTSFHYNHALSHILYSSFIRRYKKYWHSTKLLVMFIIETPLCITCSEERE